MTTILNDGDVFSYVVDQDTVVVRFKNENFVMDYSLLIDFITDLARLAKTVEKLDGAEYEKCGKMQ